MRGLDWTDDFRRDRVGDRAFAERKSEFKDDDLLDGDTGFRTVSSVRKSAEDIEDEVSVLPGGLECGSSQHQR